MSALKIYFVLSGKAVVLAFPFMWAGMRNLEEKKLASAVGVVCMVIDVPIRL